MSEGNGYATKEALRDLSRQPPRYDDKYIAGWGKIKVQSVSAGEFCRVEAAKNKALLLSSGGKISQQAAAYKDYGIEVIKAGAANPTFCDDDREFLLSLDASTFESIKDAILSHWNTDEESVESAEKKLPVTSGDSSRFDSGTT